MFKRRFVNKDADYVAFSNLAAAAECSKGAPVTEETALMQEEHLAVSKEAVEPSRNWVNSSSNHC